VPKTIDNDIVGTDVTFGFHTAVQIATDAIDRLHTTAESHDRVLIVEVMGRHAGWIAAYSGIAGGASVVLIPEIPFDIEKVSEALRELFAIGRNHSLVVCAEGVRLSSGEPVSHAFADGQVRYGGVGAALGEMIAKHTGAETRVTVLGHVQRGGSPSAFDRILASSLAAHAVDIVVEGKTNRVVVSERGKITDVPLDHVAGQTRALKLDGTLITTARQMGICLGD
jgi:6-phosphofructokinase 1